MYSKRFLIQSYYEFIKKWGRARGFTLDLIRHWAPIYTQALNTGLNIEIMAVKKRIHAAGLENFDRVTPEQDRNKQEILNECLVNVETFYQFLEGKPVQDPLQKTYPQLFLFS